MSKPSDLIQGTLDLLILKTLSLEPRHGWAIAKRIEQVRGGRAQLEKELVQWERLSNAVGLVIRTV